GEIITVLKKAADGLATVQDADGLWFQVLDKPAEKRNYHEASASCMFTYTLAKAARLGYIDAKFGDVATKAYAGILKDLIEVDGPTGMVTLKDVCQVAGLGGNPYRDGTVAYYLSEPRV